MLFGEADAEKEQRQHAGQCPEKMKIADAHEEVPVVLRNLHIDDTEDDLFEFDDKDIIGVDLLLAHLDVIAGEFAVAGMVQIAGMFADIDKAGTALIHVYRQFGIGGSLRLLHRRQKNIPFHPDGKPGQTIGHRQLSEVLTGIFIPAAGMRETQHLLSIHILGEIADRHRVDLGRLGNHLGEVEEKLAEVGKIPRLHPVSAFKHRFDLLQKSGLIDGERVDE